MKDVKYVGQLKVLQDLLKIKETDGILRVFGNKGSDYYTLEGYWYFQTEGKEDLIYRIEKADLDRLAEIGEIKLYRSENSKAIHDLEITDKGELRLAKLSHGKTIANWVSDY
jgi:hypothetical protein